MTYSGYRFFNWNTLNIISLLAVGSYWIFWYPTIHYHPVNGVHDYFYGWQDVFVVLIKCLWIGSVLSQLFRIYRRSFYFKTNADGGLEIWNNFWPSQINVFNPADTDLVEFKKMGMFDYKIRIAGEGKKSRWYGNNALNVTAWQALVEDLKVHGFNVTVDNGLGG